MNARNRAKRRVKMSRQGQRNKICPVSLLPQPDELFDTETIRPAISANVFSAIFILRACFRDCLKPMKTSSLSQATASSRAELEDLIKEIRFQSTGLTAEA